MSTLEPGLPFPADEPDDDVALELQELAIRRRRKFPRVTLALAVALVGAGAFIGGAEAQKHLGSSPSSSASSGTGGAAAAGFAGRFRGGGATTGAGAAGGGTVGTVTAIKGSTLYVTDTSGNTVKVTTSAASQVSKTVSGTVKDVLPGNTVVIRGTTQKNGTIAASSISLGGTANNNGGATGFGGGSNSNGGG